MAQSNLLGASLEEMKSLLREVDERPYRARQVYAGIYARRLTDWTAFTNLPGPLRNRLGERFRIEYPRPEAVFVSEDGTRRYLLEVDGGYKIEAVFIPEPKRETICISTQVGCAVGCLFCVTGKLPMRRNLSAGEIVGQVLALLADRGTSVKRLNVVIMGMGEPLDNYEQVVAAIRLMTDREGMAISPRRITLSTSGVVPQMERLAGEAVMPNLAISLSATTDDVRDLLIPINRKWDISTLLEACRKFPLDRRGRITFEYVLIEGINDTPEDAQRLVQLLRGLRKKVNLIPLNADPWVPLNKPSEKRILAFQQILIDGHVMAYVRRPRGDDISAACGMLAGRDYARGDLRHAPPRPARPSTLARLKGV
jgi:23S rRNA (adenine2503-C2)-methyltransferase